MMDALHRLKKEEIEKKVGRVTAQCAQGEYVL